MGQVVTDPLIGSILCLAYFVIGLAIGCWVGRVTTLAKSVNRLLPEIARAEAAEAQRLLSLCDDVRARLAERAYLEGEINPSPWEALSRRRHELMSMREDFFQALQRRRRGNQSPSSSKKDQRGRPPAGSTEPSSSKASDDQEGLSNAEILALFARQDPQLTHDGDGRAIRHRFSVRQPVAPWANDGAPPVFQTVQCHDISVTEVRYFVDDIPSAEGIVIGLGRPSPVKWLVAEIKDCRSVFMYGRVGYLVTARFVATIQNPHRTPDDSTAARRAASS